MRKLQNFNYQHVTLADTHWKQQRTELIETYLAIPNEELLHYFRKLAGLPDECDGLVGWFGNGASTFGQKIGAFARLYLVTGDVRLREKALALADGWGECARASERVLDVNTTYVYDKLMGGFLDLYEYLGYEPAREYIRWLTKSAEQRFRRGIARDGMQNEDMGPGMIEWYTLPEQLYRPWFLTKEEQYLAFAKEWDYPYYWDKLIAKDFRIGPHHAYSHVNAFSSAAMAYLATGDLKYVQAMERGYEEILAHHTFATGGYGPAECLFADEEGYLGDSVKANWDRDKRHHEYRNFGEMMVSRDDMWGSCEVSCCSWAVFKLCNYLLTITGEARFGDWAEKLLYNGCGGQLPITPEGKVMYYADYFINGAFKSVEDGRLQEDGSSFEWQCCTGTFPEDVAEYANMLYYKDQNGIYVSQYLASSAEFEMDGVPCVLENQSFYPKERELRFRMSTKEPKRFAVHFRVPSWADGRNVIRVNGEKLQAAVKPNTWLSVERCWEDGDTVTIEYEFRLRFERVDAYAPDVAALCYGPIVMVCDKMTLFAGDLDHPEDWLEPIQKDGYSFAFRTKPGHVKPYEHLTRDFYPYYEVPEMEWYYMYSRFAEC